MNYESLITTRSVWSSQVFSLPIAEQMNLCFSRSVIHIRNAWWDFTGSPGFFRDQRTEPQHNDDRNWVVIVDQRSIFVNLQPWLTFHDSITLIFVLRPSQRWSAAFLGSVNSRTREHVFVENSIPWVRESIRGSRATTKRNGVEKG